MTTNLLKKPGIVDATLILHSGNYFDLADPKTDTILISDIAVGLANTCRFGGQVLHYYSVAQHSVLVSENVPEDLAFAALMHDAAEAYVGDVIGPLKQLLPEFKVIEDRVEQAICKRFNLGSMKHPEIKFADLRLLCTEQRDLTAGKDHNWNGLDAYPALEQQIVPLMPEQAAALFLARFEELNNAL